MSNVEWNQRRWGNRLAWRERDNWGYAYEQPGKRIIDYTAIPKLADRRLTPYLPSRDIDILEIGPGAGRFTTELIRRANTLTLMDLNEACLEICKDRFKHYNHITYIKNDGKDCSFLPDNFYNLIASYDSFVHIEPEAIFEYMASLKPKLVDGGILWLDHSGHGARSTGHRTDMTWRKMLDFAKDLKYHVIAQEFRNDQDCISIMRKEAT